MADEIRKWTADTISMFSRELKLLYEQLSLTVIFIASYKRCMKPSSNTREDSDNKLSSDLANLQEQKKQLKVEILHKNEALEILKVCWNENHATINPIHLKQTREQQTNSEVKKLWVTADQQCNKELDRFISQWYKDPSFRRGRAIIAEQESWVREIAELKIILFTALNNKKVTRSQVDLVVKHRNRFSEQVWNKLPELNHQFNVLGKESNTSMFTATKLGI